MVIETRLQSISYATRARAVPRLAQLVASRFDASDCYLSNLKRVS
ncbi:hypothetical protein AVDCRST_MAG94-1719 [uncultured Leptolyngbya sp.]|uniref:Uncharacterized protein n=1 Tax=uncultured Leptolyngbya sp. TaxID=332963 RepID=A0A6J4L8T6_9CYAN|nr:hypothetical protein AVDCRST_MAG94-1719 [uncultured Leptolyngbya sp.]